MRKDILSPSYYVKNTMQVWDAIDGLSLDFYQGNILKYIVRYKDKNGLEDLKKARVYLDRMIEICEKSKIPNQG